MKTQHPLAFALALGLATGICHSQPARGISPQGNQTQPAHGSPGPPPNRPHGPPPVVRALDGDRDGILSADEIAEAPAGLRKLDKDGSGDLSREEFMPFPPKPPGPPPQAGNATHSPRGESPRIGQTGDRTPRRSGGGGPQGVGRPEERREGSTAPGVPRHPAPASAAGDPPQGPPPGEPGDRPGGRPPMPLMGALDADHDGTISSAEIDAAPAALLTLDRTQDGQLGPGEYLPHPPRPPAVEGDSEPAAQGGGSNPAGRD